MPQARTRAQRAMQVLRWVQANWPIGRQVVVEWHDEIIDDEGKPCDGDTGREGRKLVMRLSRKRNRTIRETTDTVIHECVHMIQWPVAGPAEDPIDHHPPAFGAQYWEIRDRFDHHGGAEDASEFGWE